MSTATIAFDYEDVLPSVRGADSRANADDVEEAIQQAAVELLGKGTPLTAPNIVTRARSRLIAAMSRSEHKNASLDAFAEAADDDVPVELGITETDFDAHVALSEPLAAARRAAIETGCRSVLGWTPETQVLAIQTFAKRHGRTPSWRELKQDPELPHPNSLDWSFPGLNQVIAAAGLAKRPLLCRPPWSREEAVAAIQMWARVNGRAPTCADLRRGSSLGMPAQGVVYRLWGNCTRETLRAIAYGDAAKKP